MAYVTLHNKFTGEIKSQKIGWSWTRFLFSSVLGIPLFLRGLKGWGAMMLAIWVVNIFVTFTDRWGAVVFFMLFWLELGLSAFLGIRANAMTVKLRLENGWEYAEAQAARYVFEPLSSVQRARIL
jgi:hypothetical protein